MNVYLVLSCMVAVATCAPAAQFGNGNGNYNNGARANRGRQLDEGAPAPAPAANGNGAQMPMNYQFDWNVDTEEHGNYYGQKEQADNGRVEGTYYNWLPDGRLMRVDYYVDGNSGFVPTITYEDAYQPSWGTAYLRR